MSIILDFHISLSFIPFSSPLTLLEISVAGLQGTVAWLNSRGFERATGVNHMSYMIRVVPSAYLRMLFLLAILIPRWWLPGALGTGQVPGRMGAHPTLAPQLGKTHEMPPSSRDEGLLFLHGLESNPESSLQTPQEA